MKSLFRGLGWTILVIAGLLVGAYAWLEDVKWLQWWFAGMVVCWFLQMIWNDYRATQEFKHRDIVSRLLRIEEAVKAIQRRLPQ